MKTRQSLTKLLIVQFMATCKISNYTVSPTEEFFFDTNIWMFLFAPLAGSRQNKQRAYSKLLGDIISRGATIWINSQVVAEYVNRCLRMEYEVWRKDPQNCKGNFKHDFRQTEDYKSTLRDTKAQVSAILQKSTRYPDDFHTIDIEGIISSMGTSLDYGDAVIVDLCKRKKYKLVTDDGDMTNTEFSFDVITA